jgi:2,4-dienoyl-CoA reductase (NADPH2)
MAFSSSSLPPSAPGRCASLFDPLTIKNVRFKNRILRSSIGGRTATYAGEVTEAWKNFERQFAKGGVGGIISATISVDAKRYSPLEYPRISSDRLIEPLRRAVRTVQAMDCRYILQIGDPGAHTQTSLFPQPEDGKSSSAVIDMLYGYRNSSTALTQKEIATVVDHFAQAARRVREIGCDGVELTISKGYLIHQFLNPGINRRKDEYGGSSENRFRLAREIVMAIRREVGDDFLFGVRLSAFDRNYLPLNLRWPPVLPLRHYLFGHRLKDMLEHARRLEALGVDYLHVSRGYGFPNPGETPGDFPIDEARQFLNSTRHLSGKAAIRATLLNAVPKFLIRAVLGAGWQKEDGQRAAGYAAEFKRVVGIPVIGNGGFQRRDIIDRVLREGKCDLVSMARPLLANPDLVRIFGEGRNEPDRPCTHCNRCVIATTVKPLGCYEPLRFTSQDEMEAQILRLSATTDEDLKEESLSGRPRV